MPLRSFNLAQQPQKISLSFLSFSLSPVQLLTCDRFHEQSLFYFFLVGLSYRTIPSISILLFRFAMNFRGIHDLKKVNLPTQSQSPPSSKLVEVDSSPQHYLGIPEVDLPLPAMNHDMFPARQAGTTAFSSPVALNVVPHTSISNLQRTHAQVRPFIANSSASVPIEYAGYDALSFMNNLMDSTGSNADVQPPSTFLTSNAEEVRARTGSSPESIDAISVAANSEGTKAGREDDGDTCNPIASAEAGENKMSTASLEVVMEVPGEDPPPAFSFSDKDFSCNGSNEEGVEGDEEEDDVVEFDGYRGASRQGALSQTEGDYTPGINHRLLVHHGNIRAAYLNEQGKSSVSLENKLDTQFLSYDECAMPDRGAVGNADQSIPIGHDNQNGEYGEANDPLHVGPFAGPMLQSNSDEEQKEVFKILDSFTCIAEDHVSGQSTDGIVRAEPTDIVQFESGRKNEYVDEIEQVATYKDFEEPMDDKVDLLRNSKIPAVATNIAVVQESQEFDPTLVRASNSLNWDSTADKIVETVPKAENTEIAAPPGKGRRQRGKSTGTKQQTGGPRKISKREAARAATAAALERHAEIARLAQNNQITDSQLLQLKPKKKRRSARFDNPVPSRFCHICSRTPKNVRLAVCGKIRLGTCRKVVCEKCFGIYGYGDFAKAYDTSKTEWMCPHCQGGCPARAQCGTYQRINDQLRVTRLKQERPRRRASGRNGGGTRGGDRGGGVEAMESNPTTPGTGGSTSPSYGNQLPPVCRNGLQMNSSDVPIGNENRERRHEQALAVGEMRALPTIPTSLQNTILTTMIQQSTSPVSEMTERCESEMQVSSGERHDPEHELFNALTTTGVDGISDSIEIIVRGGGMQSGNTAGDDVNAWAENGGPCLNTTMVGDSAEVLGEQASHEIETLEGDSVPNFDEMFLA